MAAARAEARRKAILARGRDRLAKLTTSARGEDHPAYSHVDPPVPSVTDGHPLAGLGGTPPDPSVLPQDLQQQFMQALMGGAAPPGMSSFSDNYQPALPAPIPSIESNIDSGDPLAALMAQLSQGQPGSTSSTTLPTPKRPPTLLQKLVPVLHLLSVWALLAYFVLWKEPEVFEARTFGAAAAEGWWRRWGELSRGNVSEGWGVQVVPFLWAFMALQIALHSLRIFSGFDEIQPPFLLTLALPHLPPPFPSLILNGLKYVQMGGFFLDDLAGLLLGLGFCVAVGGMLDR